MKKIIKCMAYFCSILSSEKIIKVGYFFVWNLMWYIKKRKFKHVGKYSFVGLGLTVKSSENITIGDNFYAEDNLRIETYPRYKKYTYSPQLIIKDNVSFGYRCHLGCINKIEIHDNCLFGSNVYISDHSHGEINRSELKIVPRERKLFSKGPIVIGENCWIGDNVCIMPNVSIGKNSIIGANSVVTHNIDKNSVAVGAPARIIKKL